MEIPIRSLMSNEKVYVRFVNETERVVEVIWINYSGMYVRHTLLEKGSFRDVNTYKTHPWIALDAVSKDRLHIDKEYVYYPETAREFCAKKYPGREIPRIIDSARLKISITLPLYSLQYRALLEVRNLLKSADKVDNLHIPRELKDNLRRVITYRNNVKILNR